MKKLKMLIKRTPSWLVFFTIFGVLYYTGWHKEIIAPIQKAVLFTGILDADIPKVEKSSSNNYKVGKGFRIKDLKNGKEVLFDQFHSKVVFLNLWATWCPPCKAEMPGIQALYEEVDSNKIEFVMLSLDNAAEQKVNDFIDEYNYTFPVYMPLEQVPKEFQTTGIPATYIISPQGKILFSHVGIANYNTEEMKSFLLELSKTNSGNS